jgi:hypothetical protein
VWSLGGAQVETRALMRGISCDSRRDFSTTYGDRIFNPLVHPVPKPTVRKRSAFKISTALPVKSRGQANITGASVRNYLGLSARFASSCTDFVVADLSIRELVDRPHASGGFVIWLANTRKLGPSGCNVDQYPDGVSNGL